MNVEVSDKERELLLELVDNEIAHLRQKQADEPESPFKEQSHEREDVLTHIVQALSQEHSDLKTAVREDHDELERTGSKHDYEL